MQILFKLLPKALVQRASGKGHAGFGAALAFSIRVGSAGLALLTSIILARWLGAHEFGIYTYVWVWLNLLGTLCTLGFATSAIRFLPGYQQSGSSNDARGFLLTGRILSFLTGLGCAALGITVLFATDGLVADYYRVPLSIGLACLPAFALTDFHEGVGRAHSWIDLALVPPYILRPLLSLALIATAFALGWPRNANVAVLALITATWLTMLAQYLLQRRRLKPILPSGFRSYDLRLWLAVSMPALLMESFSLLMINLDVLLLDLFVTPDQIAIYYAAARIISLMAFVHFAVTAVAMPRFSAAYAAGDHRELASLMSQMRKWTFIPSLAGAAGLLVFGKPLLWLFGGDFTTGYHVMFVLVAGLLARAAAGPAQGFLVVTGHHNMTALVMALGVAANLGLNLYLIPLYGLLGAAGATASAFVLESVLLTYLTKRALRQQPEGRHHAVPAE